MAIHLATLHRRAISIVLFVVALGGLAGNCPYQSEAAESIRPSGDDAAPPELVYQPKAVTNTLSALPQFQDFPVSVISTKQSAQPILATPRAREYRTQLNQAGSGTANFAGHYILAQWGCGTACVAGAVIDALTGQVTFFPFVNVCCWQNMHQQGAPIDFRVNSRLIVFSGQLDERGTIGTHYFAFRHGRFKLLRRTAG